MPNARESLSVALINSPSVTIRVMLVRLSKGASYLAAYGEVMKMRLATGCAAIADMFFLAASRIRLVTDVHMTLRPGHGAGAAIARRRDSRFR